MYNIIPKSRKGIITMKVTITVGGKPITTNTEFRQSMNHSESRTRYILAEIDGKNVTLRKHWSNDGREWDVWDGHEFETMKRLDKIIVMNLVGKPMWYTNEDGTRRSDVEKPFDCEWGHYNVEFYMQ